MRTKVSTRWATSGGPSAPARGSKGRVGRGGGGGYGRIIREEAVGREGGPRRPALHPARQGVVGPDADDLGADVGGKFAGAREKRRELLAGGGPGGGRGARGARGPPSFFFVPRGGPPGAAPADAAGRGADGRAGARAPDG